MPDQDRQSSRSKRLTETEEACHKILRALQYTVGESACPFQQKTEQQNNSKDQESSARTISHDSESVPEQQAITPKMYLPVLGSSPRDDFGRSIVKMAIIIVVEHAGVKEFLLPNRDQDLISKAIVEIVQESKLSSEVSSLVRGLRKIPSQCYFLKPRVRVLRKI